MIKSGTETALLNIENARQLSKLKVRIRNVYAEMEKALKHYDKAMNEFRGMQEVIAEILDEDQK